MRKELQELLKHHITIDTEVVNRDEPDVVYAEVRRGPFFIEWEKPSTFFEGGFKVTSPLGEDRLADRYDEAEAAGKANDALEALGGWDYVEMGEV